MSSLLSCTDLTKVYQTGETQTFALAGASCDIQKGEFVAIMGPSGSGKSTLMHILGLLDRQTEGEYAFLGETITSYTDDDLARLRNQKIGFVFQAFNLLPRASVFENVELPLLYDVYEKKKKQDRERLVTTALQAVSMTHRVRNKPNQLSGGEKQRTAIARALVNNPDIIFADEPTGNLDSVSGLQVMKSLQDLHKNGKTIVLVTHETATAEHAERIISMKDGKVVGSEKITKRRFADSDKALK